MHLTEIIITIYHNFEVCPLNTVDNKLIKYLIFHFENILNKKKKKVMEVVLNPTNTLDKQSRILHMMLISNKLKMESGDKRPCSKMQNQISTMNNSCETKK